MRWRLGPAARKKLQGVFWVYLTNNFVITRPDDFRTVEPAVKCEFLPITANNYSRVSEFRTEERLLEYQEKLARREIGFFAECGGKVVGSIWATINNSGAPTVARSYMRLEPSEAMIHDIVTGERYRGMRIGPFMVGRICSVLLNEFAVSKIVIDVNIRNVPSLRMMEKVGLQIDQRMLSVSAFGRLISHRLLKQFARR